MNDLLTTSTGSYLYESAKRLRLPELPAFALEHLPNRNSLIYGDLYGISNEASTVYRATLRYEGKHLCTFCFSDTFLCISSLISTHHFVEYAQVLARSWPPCRKLGSLMLQIIHCCKILTVRHIRVFLMNYLLLIISRQLPQI